MANNTLIGALRAEATLESGKFVDGAKKIRKESKQTQQQLKRDFSSMGAAVKGFGGALTAGLSIGLLGGLAKKALDFATSIKDVAAQAGVSTKALQEFRYAASQMGIKQAEADKGLTKLNETLGKAAAGSSSAQKALAAVGVTMEDVRKKTPTEIFGKIADQMIKQGGAAKNAAAANAVFGESAAKLNPLLDKGSQGINELAQAAQRLGIVLSDQQIQNADETARKLDDVRQVLAAQIAGVVADNASSIVSLAQALGQLTGQIVNFLGSNPQAALAILGGLAGSRFGLPGAAAGAIGGAILGSGPQAQVDQRRLEGNTGLLRHNLQQQMASIRAKRAAGQPIKQSELNRLKSLTDKLNAATGNFPSPALGGGDLPQFLAGAPRKGRAPRSPRGPRDRSDDTTFAFDQELRRAQVDVLRAQQSLATTSDQRAAIALQLLDADREMQQAELDNRVRRAERDFAEGKITAGALEQVKAQAEKLKAEYDSADALQRQAIAQELAAEKARDAAELVESGYDLKIEQAQLDAALAETAKDRRAAELRILALMKEQEKARLEAVIADKQSSELAKAQAQQRLRELDSLYAAREAGVRQGTRGPLESFGAEFGDISEELEQLKVQGIEGAANALSQLTQGWDSFRDAALSAIQAVIQELIRLQLMKLAANLLGSAAGAGGGGLPFAPSGTSGPSGFSGYVGIGSFMGGGGLPGFAGGGGFRVRGIPGIDKNTLQMNGIPIANISYGERVDISNDNEGAGKRGGDTHVHIGSLSGMTPYEGRATGRQIARGMHERVALSATGKRRK